MHIHNRRASFVCK